MQPRYLPDIHAREASRGWPLHHPSTEEGHPHCRQTRPYCRQAVNDILIPFCPFCAILQMLTERGRVCLKMTAAFAKKTTAFLPEIPLYCAARPLWRDILSILVLACLRPKLLDASGRAWVDCTTLLRGTCQSSLGRMPCRTLRASQAVGTDRTTSEGDGCSLSWQRRGLCVA